MSENNFDTHLSNSGFYVGAEKVIDQLVKLGNGIQQAAADPKIVHLNDRDYIFDPVKQHLDLIPVPEPVMAPFPGQLHIYTLDGLIEYIKANAEKLIPEDGDSKAIVHVADHKTVGLYAPLAKNACRRNIIAACHANVPPIQFDQHMTVDEFNVMLLSKFVQTDSLSKLFEVSSKLCKEQTLAVADDGVSQNVTVKQGVSLASNAVFHNPVPLRPIRTFPEIEQPESNFTFRVDEHANPALFEADGGFWRNEAVRRIGKYLKDKLYDNVVIVA